MSKLKERPLADFVRSRASDAQLLDLWSKIEGAEARRVTRRRRLRVAAGASAVGILVGALVLVRSPAPAPVAVDHSVERAASEPSASDAPQELALADGSRLLLSTGTRARVLAMRADEVRVRLESGEVDCEVAPDRGRRFVVEAGEFEVVVTGTSFTVNSGAEANASSVAVSVERGSVEVWEPPHRLLAALGAGQRWASERQANSVDAPDAGGAARGSPSSNTAGSNTAGSSNTAASSSASAPSRAAPAAPGGTRPAPPPADASTLLSRASAARQAGKLPEAVAALERLIRQHPNDERAGYAAFLLGRLQLDTLGDARAAVGSFSFAAAHPGSGFFPEDAEARRVEALAKAGQMKECVAARDRFLAKYPNAARATSIQGACR
jgi:TolA-binding protein